jgi:hypothetical protein
VATRDTGEERGGVGAEAPLPAGRRRLRHQACVWGALRRGGGRRSGSGPETGLRALVVGLGHRTTSWQIKVVVAGRVIDEAERLVGRLGRFHC